MGHQQHGLAVLAPDPQQFLLQEATRQRIERAERLIHQDRARLRGKHARQRHTLFHAARERIGPRVAEFAETHQLEVAVGNGFALLARHALLTQPESDIVPDVEPWEQRVLLEHHAAPHIGTGHLFFVHKHRARAWRLEAGHDIEQGALAAAGRADQRDKLAGGDVERHRPQGFDRFTGTRVVKLGDIVDDHAFTGRVGHSLVHVHSLKPSRWPSMRKPASIRIPSSAMITMPASTWSDRRISMPLAIR
ncbi:hypothetical protein D3C87_1062760 [compost metagenome]